MNPRGEVALEGVDFAQVGEDGQLSCVTGYFGPLPGREADS
jgi:hypothetical protein